jgi:methylmalonyl-CoA mutase cobalamin-binding domain/chain
MAHPRCLGPCGARVRRADQSTTDLPAHNLDDRPVSRASGSRRERELRGSMREEHTTIGNGQRLLCGQVAARARVVLGGAERRLAQEEIHAARKLGEPGAGAGVAGVGDGLALGAVDAEAARDHPVVFYRHGDAAAAGNVEPRASGVLGDIEGPVEHAGMPEGRAELVQRRAASRRKQDGGAADHRRSVAREPDPWDEVTPVVEMEMRDQDRVHRQQVVPAHSRQDAWTAIEQEPALIRFDEVAGVCAARVRPSGRGADDGQSHVHILTEMSRPIRVVIAKPGLDGHDRGAKVIARALRDAGFEVIYTGLHQTPEQIVETAIQEDADAVGISILSGAHMTLVPRILEGLRENGVGDVLVLVGGTIPKEDAHALKDLGVAEVFTPGAPLTGIVDFLRSRVPA